MPNRINVFNHKTHLEAHPAYKVPASAHNSDQRMWDCVFIQQTVN